MRLVKSLDNEFSLKSELKRIKDYLISINEETEFRWVKKLIDKIGIKDFNSTFVIYQNSLEPYYIDLDSAYNLYQELFED